MRQSYNRLLFMLFFMSGFCGLLYQVIWVRLAFASFGIITPVLSVVISTFMLGLCLGTWSCGRFIFPLTNRIKISPLIFYAFSEGMIGVGAFTVPLLFTFGEKLLSNAGQADSFKYLLCSALILAFSILPWCLFMGATIPCIMAFVKRTDPGNHGSFSFLYLANVIGALAGTLTTAFVLIELLGFRQTLWLAGCLNFCIAFISVILAIKTRHLNAKERDTGEKSDDTPLPSRKSPYSSAILFVTGFVSLGMEVAWTRAFTSVMGTQVYAFAIVLAAYLVSTCFGSHQYRHHLASHGVWPTGRLLAGLSFLVFLPIVLTDPRLIPGGGRKDLRIFLIILSIMPFCALLGYLTPKLIDEYAEGHPRSAGRSYALNILGCILGPLTASYMLLPWLGAQFTLLLLGAPFFAFLALYFRSLSPQLRWIGGGLTLLFFSCSSFVSRSYEEPYGSSASYSLKRDHTATVIARGEGMNKRLLVNGQGMTGMTPITKFMAHLPLAFHKGKSDSALVICFGMGTTFRSMLRWDVHTTAVELVPSVVNFFDYYFADANEFLKNPKGKIVIDDGRRYLKRTAEQYDVITIDPPPPAETAGASLLYSEDFYTLIKQHLKPEGILQQWYPLGKPGNLEAIARSLSNSFPHIRVYGSAEGWGRHFLASLQPLEDLSAENMVARMPEAARQDLLEWSTSKNLTADIRCVLSRRVSLEQILSPNLQIRVRDDRPFNEYFWLRQTLHRPICSWEIGGGEPSFQAMKPLY